VIAPVLPWVQGATLEILRADAVFMALVGGRVDSEPAADATTPYAVVWPPGNVPGDAAGVSWRCMQQVSAWSPKLPNRDVKGVVWEIAARAHAVLAGIDQHRYRNFGFTTRAVGISAHLPDHARADSVVLYGAYAQVELIGQAF
jgi:hypothetical protein